MTIDEAISHAREVAEKKRRKAKLSPKDSFNVHIKSDCLQCAQEHEQLAKWLEELQQYRAIGTPEECRAAVEKQTAKLVIDNTPTEDSVWYQCPTCKGDLTTIRGFYCQYCGQKLHWR